MNFTLHQLRVFTIVADKSSITKASEALNMSQPAVSIQLKNLQDQFDIPLTEVIGRKLYITDFGRELYSTARRILEEADSISTQTQRFKGLLTGKLKVTVVSTGKYVMPYYLKDFLSANPAVDLQMDVTNKARVIDSLENNEVDFSLISVMPDEVKLNQEILMANRLFLAGPGNEKEMRATTDKAIFDTIPLIYRETGSGTRTTMQAYFNRAGISPKIRLELASNEAVKQAVMAGLGYSILSLLSLKHELKQGDISLLNVKGLPLRSDWRLVWMPQKKFSVVAKAYLQYIQQQKAVIYQNYFSWVEQY